MRRNVYVVMCFLERKLDWADFDSEFDGYKEREVYMYGIYRSEKKAIKEASKHAERWYNNIKYVEEESLRLSIHVCEYKYNDSFCGFHTSTIKRMVKEHICKKDLEARLSVVKK